MLHLALGIKSDNKLPEVVSVESKSEDEIRVAFNKPSVNHRNYEFFMDLKEFLQRIIIAADSPSSLEQFDAQKHMGKTLRMLIRDVVDSTINQNKMANQYV